MKTNLRGKDFISTQEWTKEELETVLHLAFDLKMKWGLDLPTRLLEDKTLFMLFFFSSTRTRNSFEAGMTRLGGHAIFLEPDKMQISHGDTPKEIGKILSSYGHGIAIRHCDWGEGNKYLRDVAEHARDRKSTRLNSSHLVISYAVFCLKKKNNARPPPRPPRRPAPRTHTRGGTLPPPRTQTAVWGMVCPPAPASPRHGLPLPSSSPERG